MRIVFGAMVALCVVALTAASSLACSLIPWNYDQLAPGAKALVYGRVLQTETGGRSAVLSVTSYVGQGKAPKEVRVGPTEYSGSREWDCPDSSVVFQDNDAYLVLLSEGSPTFQLAYPQWATAIPVDSSGMMLLQQDSDRRESVKAIMAAFAATNRLSVRSGYQNIAAPVVIGLGASGCAGAIAWRWFQRRPH